MLDVNVKKIRILTFIGSIIIIMFNILKIYKPYGFKIGTMAEIVLILYVLVTIYVYKNKNIK